MCWISIYDSRLSLSVLTYTTLTVVNNYTRLVRLVPSAVVFGLVRRKDAGVLFRLFVLRIKRPEQSAGYFSINAVNQWFGATLVPVLGDDAKLRWSTIVPRWFCKIMFTVQRRGELGHAGLQFPEQDI